MMYYYVLYGIIALNMVPLRGKHSRKFVAACTALYMIVVYSLNVYSPDQTIYSQYYSTGQTDNYFEWIYLALGSICLQIGLSYQMFKLLHCLFTVFSVCTLCKAADYEDVKSLLFFWLLSVFCIQSEQSRFFLASMIFLYAFQYVSNPQKKNTIKYVIAILIAGQINALAYLYLLGLLCNIKKKSKKIIKVLIFVELAFCFFIFLNGNDLSFLADYISRVTGIERLKLWFSFKTRFGFLYAWCIQVIMLITLWLIRNGSKFLSEKQESFIYATRRMVEISSFLFPAYMVSTEFSRFQRPIMLLFVLACSMQYKKNKMQNKVIILSMIILLIMLHNVFVYGSVIPYYTENMAHMFTHVVSHHFIVE